jgi:hypothetical protein
MVSHLFYYQLAVLALAWPFVMLHVTGSKPGLPASPMPAKPKRPRCTEPKLFSGLTQRPHCALCERETVHPNPPAPVPPDPLPPTNRVVSLQRAGKYQRPVWRTVKGTKRPRREAPHGIPLALSPLRTPSTPAV